MLILIFSGWSTLVFNCWAYGARLLLIFVCFQWLVDSSFQLVGSWSKVGVDFLFSEAGGLWFSIARLMEQGCR